VGRIAVEVNGDFPVLVMTKRMPKQLESVLVIGEGTQSFQSFEPKLRREEGGKIEHVEYDKGDSHFQRDTNAETRVAEVINLLRIELDKQGPSPIFLLSSLPHCSS